MTVKTKSLLTKIEVKFKHLNENIRQCWTRVEYKEYKNGKNMWNECPKQDYRNKEI